MSTLKAVISFMLWTLLTAVIKTQTATSPSTKTQTVAKTDDENNATLDDYSRLLVDLFSTYDSSLGPRHFLSNKTEVNIAMKPYILYEMDTTEQEIRVDLVAYITWTDEFLVWDPALYEGIDIITLPLERIWHPDISMMAGKTMLANNVEAVTLRSSGMAFWFLHLEISFPCAVDVTYYPFDTQTCTLLSYLSMISASVAKLRLSPWASTNTLAYENSEWELIDFNSHMTYKGSEGLINASFTIRRRITFNIYTMFLPLVALSIINVFTVLVPISSGDKGSISITIFLAYGFFATIIRDDLPHNSLQISSYIIYICVLIIISVSTCVYAMIQSRIYSRYGHKKFKRSFCYLQKYPEVFSVKQENRGSENTDNENEKEDSTNSESVERQALMWEDVLSNVDMFVFVVLMIALIVLNISFWIRIIQARQAH